MGKIFWLASYPKSGNTWLRILLTNYLRNSNEPADINELDGGPIASSRVWFDEWTGIEASALNDTIIERLRPEVYRCLVRETKEPLFMKVHDAWGRTDRQQPLFPADVTGGVVYIIRNPLDMVASCANHWGVSIAAAVDNLVNPDFALAQSSAAIANQLCQKLGSWSSHVQSWVDQAGLPICLVRYEDVHQNTEALFEQVVRFCGLPFDEKRVCKAVAFSNFAELKRQEAASGFNEGPVTLSSSFFRRGQVGAWREELPAELAERIIEAHGEVMRRFGYLDADNNNL